MLNKKAFKDVYDKHFDVIRNFVFYRCGDIELASDVAQDVFMKIWEKRSFLNGDNLIPLLYKIASDCYVGHYRKKLCRMNFERSMIATDYAAASPEDEMSFNELAAVYAETLRQMSDRQRTTFLMNREDGMKYAEIADSLRISVKAVEKHISAALRLLRTKLL